MTFKLPFGLKTKPIRRYVRNHSISFRSTEGNLFCLVRYTAMYSKYPLIEFQVTSKEQLDKLTKAESIDEILLLTQVIV